MGGIRWLMLLVLQLHVLCVSAAWEYSNPEKHPRVPSYGPQPAPPYMVDNTLNYYGVAPDKGRQNGAVWKYSGSHAKFVSNLRAGKVMRGGFGNNTSPTLASFDNTARENRAAGSYWVAELAKLGSQPRAGSGYEFYRNVLDFGADNTGGSDTVEAINAAVADGDRCGEECGNTFSLGAIVYFPPGTYKVCSPIIQLYYTQFIGDANDPPTILGCDEFKGIGLIDTDPYIPGGNGANWYINQNQFFRQIRNFIFDLREMPQSTDDNDQPLVPTGIHWQVSQATSLQNLVFEMPEATEDDKTTAVGIFTENGSGGFVSDLTFNGGNIGWRAGSQQYTAQNLKFNNCLTAVQMIWDWGWVWQRIQISGGSIGFNISGAGGIDGQGIGSISVVDSQISNVEVGILTNSQSNSPHIVLDNVEADGVDRMVQVSGGDTLLTASGTVKMWTAGKVYKGDEGSDVTGTIDTPSRASSLLDNGKLFVRTRPQYESAGTSDFSTATSDGGCKNDGTGDQTDCLNSFLRSANSAGKIAYFPAGVYQVGGTVLIPTGSRVVGSSWSQIQGTGFYFSDMTNPKVVVQVGIQGEVGKMEISDMLFTVAGNTAGAIVLEWNVAAVTQGAAAMWDSHIRVGGATGTDLDAEHCPKREFNELCIAASLMMHVTKQASGYFENVWVWTADHDNDMSVYDSPDKMSNQISVYCARGLLIESQGPSWFYGGGSEHSVLYNYVVHGAKDVYLGHIQTETPYYQPEPIAPKPFNVAKGFPGDPDFSGCNGDSACASAWGMIVSNSKSVTVHGAGLYSFFQDYYQDCLETNDCQQRILRVTGSTDVVFLNLFTVAISNLAEGIDKTVISKDSNQRGFTTEISVWLPLDGADNINTVFVGTEIWTASTVTCSDASCLLVFPTSSLSAPVAISPSPFTTSFEYGAPSTVTQNGAVTVTFITTTTTTVLTIAPITTDGIAYSNYNISSGQSTIDITPSVDVPPATVLLPDGQGSTTSRTIPLPPWPLIDEGPTGPVTIPIPSGNLPSGSGTFYTGVTSTVTVSGAMVTTVTFPGVVTPTTVVCPPDDIVVFATPSTSIYTECLSTTTIAIGFNCPTTKVVSFLGPTTGVVSVDCSVVTGFPPATTPDPTPDPTSDPATTPLPVWTTWPPGIIVPIETEVEKPEPTNGGTKQPCKLWFFWVCIDTDDLHIGGWFWSFPPGIYPPGPPPGIVWPPGVTLTGPLPPWPPITIGPNGELTYSEEPQECTTTQTASICTVKTTFSVSTDRTVTTTTGSTSTTICETISGCSVSQSTTEQSATTTAACTRSPAGGARLARPSAGPSGMTNQTIIGRRVANNRNSFQKRADEDPVDVVIYPKSPTDKAGIALILAELSDYPYEVADSDQLAGGYTAFIWVPALTRCDLDKIAALAAVKRIYDYKDYNRNNIPPAGPNLGLGSNEPFVPRGLNPMQPDQASLQPMLNATTTDSQDPTRTQLRKREATSLTIDKYFNLALISIPPTVEWKKSERGGKQGADSWIYNFDDSAGNGMNVYAIGEPGGVKTDHEEWPGTKPQKLPTLTYGTTKSGDALHGTRVAGAINGKNLGVCRGCRVAYTGYEPAVPEQLADGQDWDPDPRDWVLYDLLKAFDDMTKNGGPEKSVVNMSWGSKFNFWTPEFVHALYDILKRMDRAGVTLVAAAGNWGRTADSKTGANREKVDTFPQLFADENSQWKPYYQDPQDSNDKGYLPNLIVVGATSAFGSKAFFSQDAPFVTTYAFGDNLYSPKVEGGYGYAKGTSFAAPQVAGLAAYLKALPSRWRTQLNSADSSGPQAVKAMIVALQRTVYVRPPAAPSPARSRKMVWNGMDERKNCLLDSEASDICPKLPEDITTPPEECGQAATFGGLLPAGFAMGAESNSTAHHNESLAAGLERRQAGGGGGGACTLPGGGGGGTPITLTTGPTVGPTCGLADGCGGSLCAGYWCAPTPTGRPPGYQDPKDPSSADFTPAPTTVDPTSRSSTTAASSTTKDGPPAEPTSGYSLCMGSVTSPGSPLTQNYYTVYFPSDRCNTRKITETYLGESEPICNIPRGNVRFDWCGDGDAVFRDSGPQFFEQNRCGFQIEIGGRTYTPKRLDPSSRDNPCFAVCGLSFESGHFLWDNLPGCPGRRESPDPLTLLRTLEQMA